MRHVQSESSRLIAHSPPLLEIILPRIHVSGDERPINALGPSCVQRGFFPTPEALRDAYTDLLTGFHTGIDQVRQLACEGGTHHMRVSGSSQRFPC